MSVRGFPGNFSLQRWKHNEQDKASQAKHNWANVSCVDEIKSLPYQRAFDTKKSLSDFDKVSLDQKTVIFHTSAFVLQKISFKVSYKKCLKYYEQRESE